jgi:excisionase family DNA binding protein
MELKFNSPTIEAILGHKSKRLYTVEEAASYLGLSPRTIYNGIAPKAKKKFPIKPRRYGRKPLFEKAELDRFAESLPR